jgi:dolichol kinase
MLEQKRPLVLVFAIFAMCIATSRNDRPKYIFASSGIATFGKKIDLCSILRAERAIVTRVTVHLAREKERERERERDSSLDIILAISCDMIESGLDPMYRGPKDATRLSRPSRSFLAGSVCSCEARQPNLEF